VRTHVTLKVEVGELIILLKLEKLAELGISKNTASVLGVLKLMSTNVRVNLTSDLGASHLSPLGLSKETSELKTNLSRLYKTTGSTVTRLTLLATLLRSLLKLPVSALGKSTNLSSYSGELRTERGELSEKTRELVR
jgi:phosphate uptake regulator